MPALQPKQIKDALLELMYHIDTGEELDVFTKKRYLEKFGRISDEPTRLLLIALTYGACHEIAVANGFFKEAAKFKDVNICLNYLTFLTKTNQFELYYSEATCMASEMNSIHLCISARNAAYSFGDPDNAMLFARKAMSLMLEDDLKKGFEMDTNEHLQKLNSFIEKSGIAHDEMVSLTNLISKIARDFGVLNHSKEY